MWIFTHATAYAVPLLALDGLAFSTLTHAQAVEDDAWHFNEGVGLMSQPSYPGSSKTRTGALPSFGASKGRWQLGAVPGAGVPLGVGYTLMQANNKARARCWIHALQAIAHGVGAYKKNASPTKTGAVQTS